MITIATRNLFALAAGALQALVRIRKTKFDAVVDLEFFTRFSVIVTFLSQTACRDNLCMQAITVDQVFAAVVKIYRARKLSAPSQPSASEPATRDGAESALSEDLVWEQTALKTAAVE